MPNKENLISNAERTPKEIKENATKAGKASGEARRNKKLFQSAVLTALKAKTEDGQDVLATLIAAQIKKAQEGDTRAFEVLRDTSGEKPTDKVEASVTNDNKDLMRDYLNAIKQGK